MRHISPEPQLVVTLQSIARANAIAVCGAGILVMLGWIFDIAAFRSVLTSLAALRFNIGVCLALAGIALYNIANRPRLAQVLAAIVLLIGFLTLGEHVFGWDMGIDQLLMKDTTISTSPTFSPGRMSYITAVLFSLVGCAIILSARKHHRLGQSITLIALLIALLALLGYTYDVTALYRVAQTSAIALHTAFIFIILAIGIMISFPDQAAMTLLTANSAGGYLARYALPAVLVIPLIIGWVEWQGEQVGLYTTGFGLAMFTLSHMVMLSILTFWIAGKVHTSDMERQRAIDARRQTFEELEIRSSELLRANTSLAQEVAQRTQAEAELNKLNAELEQRVHERTVHLTAIIKELDAFNYSVSHDLRSPLRTMDGYAQALLEDQGDVLDDQAKHYLSRIRAASQRMGVVIDDLLQLAQLSRNEMLSAAVDLNHLVRDVIEELKEENPDREVSYSIEEPLTATGDERLLRVAFQNLLGNAWKFTRRQASPVVEVGTIEHEGQHAFFVRDNGVGFDMRYSNKLFRAFQRLHDVQEFEGSGIGLAIVARIIQRHGGQIWAESGIGQGTTFYFTL